LVRINSYLPSIISSTEEPHLSHEFLLLDERMLESFSGYFVIGKLWDIIFNFIGMALRFPQKLKNEPDFENCLQYSY